MPRIHWKDGLAQVHRWSAALWLIGVATFPPIEGASSGILLAAAAIRWKEFGQSLRGRRRLRLIVALYVCLMAWAAVTMLWGSGQGDGVRDLRLMLMPLAFIHSGLTAGGVIAAALIGGGLWATVGLFSLAGASPPAWLQPPHQTRTYLGMQMMGVSALSLLLTATRWPMRAAAFVTSAVWGIGAMHWASRTLVIACGLAMCIGGIRQGRYMRRIAIALLCLASIGTVAVIAAPNAPLVRKVSIHWKQFLVGDDGETSVPSAQQLDALLSSRLVIWHWTLSQSGLESICGHGFSSWKTEFASAMERGDALPEWNVRSKKVLSHITHAHNIFLQVLFEQGAVGLLLLLSFLVTTWLALWKADDQLVSTLGIMCVILLVLVKSANGGDLVSRPSSAHFALCLCLASAALARQAESRTAEPAQPAG